MLRASPSHIEFTTTKFIDIEPQRKRNKVHEIAPERSRSWIWEIGTGTGSSLIFWIVIRHPSLDPSPFWDGIYFWYGVTIGVTTALLYFREKKLPVSFSELLAATVAAALAGLQLALPRISNFDTGTHSILHPIHLYLWKWKFIFHVFIFSIQCTCRYSEYAFFHYISDFCSYFSRLECWQKSLFVHSHVLYFIRVNTEPIQKPIKNTATGYSWHQTKVIPHLPSGEMNQRKES